MRNPKVLLSAVALGLCLALAHGAAALAEQDDDTYAEAVERIEDWAAEYADATTHEELVAAIEAHEGMPTDSDSEYQRCVDTIDGWIDLR
jgi:hypothetical protein